MKRILPLLWAVCTITLLLCPAPNADAEVTYIGEFCISTVGPVTIGSLKAQQQSSTELYRFGLYYYGNNHFALHGSTRETAPEPLFGSALVDPSGNFVAVLNSTQAGDSGVVFKTARLRINLAVQDSGKFSGTLSTLDLSWQPGGMEGVDVPVQFTFCP